MHQEKACKYFKSSSRLAIASRSTEKGAQALILVFLCLMSMDFQTRFFYFAFALFGVLIILQRLNLKIPQVCIPALVLSVSMCVFSKSTRGWALAMVRPFAYPLCVIVGYNMINTDNRGRAEKQIFAVLISLALGAYIHYLLNMIYNWGRSADRNTFDYWTKSVLAATGQSSLASLMIGIIIPLLFSEVKAGYKLLLFSVLFSILYYNLMLGGRTIFILVIILLFLNIVSKWIRKKTSQTRIKIILSLILTIIIILTIVQFNIFGIKDIFYRSNFFYRFFVESEGSGVTEDGRLTYRLLYLKNMIFYPFGGNELHNAVGRHYAHDLLLDTYSDSGVFSFVALVIMLIMCVLRTKMIYKSSLLNTLYKDVLFNSIVVFFVIFAVEPIFDGMPWLFASFCVIYGAIAKATEITNTKHEGKINAYCRN